MTTAVQPAGSGALDRPASQGLADVVETILDKGLVIDAYVSVSLVGIELLTANARIVIASVDTYLRFAEAVNRLDLTADKGQGLPDLVDQAGQGAGKGMAKSAAVGALEAAGDKLRSFATSAGQRREPAGQEQ
jgi:hypothetical protein